MFMYRQILIPTEKDHKIELPADLYGKRVEVIAFEIAEEKKSSANKNSKDFLDDIESIPDFPSIDLIRKNAWPPKG